MTDEHVDFSEFADRFRAADPEGDAFSLGPLTFWIKASGGDWLCRTARGKGEAAAPGAPEHDEGWRRIGSYPEMKSFHLKPALPARPVVVRPEFPYVIQPGERLYFFVSVPISVQILNEAGVVLMEEPVVQLSNTWFGAPVDGELCFAMRTLARRELERLDFRPWRVVCPVRIRNQSKETMSFERLCLRVPYLTIYEKKGKGMWANESGVTIRGEESWSRVVYARGAPPLVPDARLLAESRDESRGSFALRSLNWGKGFFQ